MKLKFPGPEFTKDDDALLEFLKANHLDDYVQVKETPLWGELKKVVKVVGNVVIAEDGQIVDGVKVQERGPIFEVEV